MSYDDGWAALNMDMPPRVPRTEYSVEMHWPLLRRVTGLDVDGQSQAETIAQARRAFFEAWQFDFFWNILVQGQIFGDDRTRMGHAEYQERGAEFDQRVGSPFESVEQVLALDPWLRYGPIDRRRLVAAFEADYRDRCREHPGGVNMTGIYVTLVSGLLEILGWQNLLMALGCDAAGFGQVAARYASWIQQYFDALADADVPVVMVHDDIVWTSGPFCHADWYRAHVFPHYRRFFAPLIESGKKIMFTSDGNYTMFIDDIAAAGAHGFVMEPTTDMGLVAEKYGRTHVFIGNADTRILLSGGREAIRDEVARCMAIGKGCPGFFMAVGNHIPPNTPVENAIYYNEVYEELSRR